jgi:hypothetical protein
MRAGRPRSQGSPQCHPENAGGVAQDLGLKFPSVGGVARSAGVVLLSASPTLPSLGTRASRSHLERHPRPICHAGRRLGGGACPELDSGAQHPVWRHLRPCSHARCLRLAACSSPAWIPGLRCASPGMTPAASLGTWASRPHSEWQPRPHPSCWLHASIQFGGIYAPARMHAGCAIATCSSPVWIPGLRCASPGMTLGHHRDCGRPARIWNGTRDTIRHPEFGAAKAHSSLAICGHDIWPMTGSF